MVCCRDPGLASTQGVLPRPAGAGRPLRHLSQQDLNQFVVHQPQRPLRPLPPHPYVVALLLGLLAWGLWRCSRPLQLQFQGRGIRIGSRVFPRHTLLGCAVQRCLGRSVLVLTTSEGRWRSPPLQIPGWQVELLCDEIQALIVDAVDAVDEARAGEHLRSALRTLRRGSERGQDAAHTTSSGEAPREP